MLQGDMSLVGPRQMLLDELALLRTPDDRRHLHEAGHDRTVAVAGRRPRYVENLSPALDLVIIVKTVKAVATGRRAH